MGAAGRGLAGGFGALDWAVVALVLLGTTLLGHRLAGRQSGLRDFFLGGRRLPWYAVAASIVATEISAVTYVSLPSVVFREGGDLAYLQIALIGSLIARAIVGYVLVPAYYEREIYSPYDYMGARLGEGTRRLTTLLFALGGVLGQSARVYVTAVVLRIVLFDELAAIEAATGLPPLAAAVLLIGAVAVLWTWMGGIATVVWTDAVLFLLFASGVAIALTVAAGGIEGGLSAAFAAGAREGKLRLFDFDTDPTQAFTFWAALLAASWGQVGPYGTDQLMTQRLFCCRDAREARRAILASYAAVVMIAAVALVGVALWAWYREHPLQGTAAELVRERPDRVFPVFLVEAIPAGFKGLVVAGVFAAAITSLDSILAALSQTTLSALWAPWRERRRRAQPSAPGVAPAGDAEREARLELRVSRTLVLAWGVVLCAAAIAVELVAQRYDSILDLALAMASYTGGALLAGFALAFLPGRRDGSGFVWSAPLSVLCVFALVWHAPWAVLAVELGAGALVLLWLARRLPSDWRAAGAPRALGQLAALAAGAVLPVLLARHALFDGGRVLAWPWYVPIGSLVAFAWGIALLEHPAARSFAARSGARIPTSALRPGPGGG